MKNSDLIRLRSKIVAMLANLETVLGAGWSAIIDHSNVTPSVLQDESDAVKGELDLKNTMRIHRHSASQMDLLKSALARMECGNYGVCQRCADEINMKRLEAMPGALLCVDCQGDHEACVSWVPTFTHSLSSGAPKLRAA